MHNFLSLEQLAHDVVQQRIEEAAQLHLASQLAHSELTSDRLAGWGMSARVALANALRAVACRIDACAAPEVLAVQTARRG